MVSAIYGSLVQRAFQDTQSADIVCVCVCVGGGGGGGI